MLCLWSPLAHSKGHLTESIWINLPSHFSDPEPASHWNGDSDRPDQSQPPAVYMIINIRLIKRPVQPHVRCGTFRQLPLQLRSAARDAGQVEKHARDGHGGWRGEGRRR